jgi:hypothetical protein
VRVVRGRCCRGGTVYYISGLYGPLRPRSGHATSEAATVAHDLAQRMLGQVEALLADAATDLLVHLRAALAALANTLAEQTADGATVTTLDTPLARAWRAHPVGWRR